MLLLERDPLVRGVELQRSAGGGMDRGGGMPSPRRATLVLWVAVVALTHFDRGATTVAAMDAVAAWGGHGVGEEKLSMGRAVALSAWHSVGLALGSMLAGAAFQQVSAKALLVLALLVDAGAVLAVGLQAEAGIVEMSFWRLISGLAAAFPLVYLPLWVDEFSPSEAGGQWMAIVQIGTPLGQFLGVLVAALATAAQASSGLGWRLALLAQAMLLVPAALRVLLIPMAQIDVTHISSRSRLDSLTLYPAEGSQLGHLHGLMREMREMMQGVSRSPLAVSVSAALCLLHSTAALLAIWAGPYLALSPGAPLPLASLLAAAIALAVSPSVGTYVGAILCDRLDGFKSGHHAAALRVACGFVGLAAVAGPLSGGCESFLARLALVVFWLVGAGAFLPISAGVLMTSMPSYLRSFSSASSLLVFHLLSFAIVPMVFAGLMSCFSRPEKGLYFGVGAGLWATAPAAVVLLVAYAREPKCAVPAGLAGADDLTFGDISYELSRRRMSTAPL